MHFFLASLLAVGSLPLNIINTYAADTPDVTTVKSPTDAPEHQKTLTPNGDGTYTVTLSVTGKASSSTVQNVTKSNVILLVDTSSSMNGRAAGYSGTRLEAEKNALTKTDGIIDKLLANNTDEVTDAIELYGINFGTGATRAWDWSTNGSSIKSAINGLTTNTGTNWEEALILAKQAADDKHAAEPDENTYVIFMTDGEPTTHQNDYSVNTNFGQEWGYASDNAREIVTAGYNFYGIFTFGTGNSSNYLKSLVNYAYTGSGTYNSPLSSDYAQYFYDATDTQALIDALEAIVDEISSSVGYTNIAMTDGLTDLTSSMKIDGKISDLTYTRSGGSYGSGTVWADAPQATTTDDAINWDLGSTVLEDGVTYSVSFLVWPKQESYDLVADLNNGKISYDELTDSQKSSIIESSDGLYTLKTNTDYPTLTYSTITTTTSNAGTETIISDPTTINIENPKPVGLANEKLTLEKKWEDTLDPSQREEVNGEVTLHFYKDDQPYEQNIKLTEADDWMLEDYISIAPGIIVSSESDTYDLLKHDHIEYSFDGKTYIILETGHDYYFEEENINSHFELTNYIYHPMLVDNQMKNVFFTYDESGNITGIEEFKDMSSVSATNTLKGGINIEKKVVDQEGNSVDTDDTFEITAYLLDADGEPYSYDYRVYYGEKNPEYENESNEIAYNDDGSIKYVRSGHKYGTGELTETLYVGDTIRIVNVDSGVQYYIEETEKNGYAADPVITYKEAYGTEDPGDATQTEDGRYYVVSGNSASYVTVTNTFLNEKTRVDFQKNWYDGNGNILTGDDLPGSITVELFRKDTDGNLVTTDKTKTITAANDWKGSFEGLPKYDNGEEIIYSVTEIEVDGTTFNNEDIFYKYDTEENNGKYAVLGQWKVMTLEDYILQNTWTPATEVVTGSTSFNIYKIDASTEKPLEGVTFELKLSDGSTITKTTDENGEATFDGLDAGEYSLKETSTPEGYKSIATEPTISITKIKKLNDVNLAKLKNIYEYVYSISTTQPAGYEFDSTHRTFTVENEPIPYDDITITKVWDDEDNHDGVRPNSLDVTLLADGENDEDVTLTAQNAIENDANTWTYVFEHKPTTTVSGNAITYTVKEDETAIGDYKASYDQDNLTITNSYTPATTDVKVSKKWEYNGASSELYPTSIKVGLYDERDNRLDEKTVTPNDDGEWTCEFNDLPVYRNEDGVASKITYSVKEIEVDGTTFNNEDIFYKYDTEENNGKYAVLGQWKVMTLEDYILQNTWTPATEEVTGLTSINIHKIDSETEDELSGAVFKLKADDGTEITRTTNDSGEATFEDLDAGVYTISEVTAPEGHIELSSSSTITITKIKKLMSVNLAKLHNTYEYEFSSTATSADGYEFDASTNTFTIENDPIIYNDITVYKVWDDDNNRDGVRASSVTINLVGSDGSAYEGILNATDNATEDDENTWSYLFEDIPSVTSKGETITYQIEEDETGIGNYEASYDQDTLTVTNSYEPETTNIYGHKIWEDDNNISGLRPTSLEFILLNGDGEVIDSTIIFEDENGDWNFSFEGLPKNQNVDGEVSEIEYTVEEVVNFNYIASYDIDEDGCIVVTNTLKGRGEEPPIETPETGRITLNNSNSVGIAWTSNMISGALVMMLGASVIAIKKRKEAKLTK